MKKMMLLLAIILVFSLTGCSNSPFESDDADYTFLETDSIEFEYNNGVVTETVFSYQFSTTYKMFVNADYTIYNFKNINNYKDLSTELKALFESFDGRVSFSSETSYGYDTKQKLSLGATENNFNYETVKIEDEAYNVTAFIAAENGVTMLVSYSQFFVGEETYLIPSYIQLFAAEIHQGISYESIEANNDYDEEQGELIHYSTMIVPLPMKTGYDTPYAEMQEKDVVIIDNFTRFEAESFEIGAEWPRCEILSSTSSTCSSSMYTELDVQMFEMTAGVSTFLVNLSHYHMRLG